MIPEKNISDNNIRIEIDRKIETKNIKEKEMEVNNNIYNKKFMCDHGCHHIFKSMRQKLLHHDKLDDLCHNEKMNILILLEQFNICINKILPDEEKEKYKEYILLIKNYQKSKNKMRDKAQFEALVHIK